MYNPLTVAYVAFAMLVVMTLIAIRFTYRLFSNRLHFSVRTGKFEVRTYYYVVALLALISYLSVCIVLLALTATHGSRWAEWSWRWSVGSALLDSICAIKSTREWSKFPQVIYFQIVVASIEIALVLILPAIPIPAVRTYLNLGVIIFHSLWTSLSTWSWTCGRRRVVRWGASVGQCIGAVSSIWSPLAFVIIFCTFSIIICTEELNESRQSFWRISSNQERNSPGIELEKQYKVLFLGQCSQRSDALRKVVKWKLPRMSVGGVEIFSHPTIKGVDLASVSPDVSRGLMDKETYIRGCIKSSSAIVLVLDLFDDDSWKYIESLRSFSEGQPILLVACNVLQEDWQLLSNLARDYAHGRGWDYTIVHNLESAFGKLMRKMRTRPPSGVQSVGTSRSRFEV
ncbi:hypothetical protein F4803DRAFT_575018 [Xylaria telfairii]|nr:hypothetical protein F4803DRAFT_575018 [Xylaria telfairii]